MSERVTKPLGKDVELSDLSIWESILAVVDTVPGWSPPEELLALYQLALLTKSNGGDVLEIGTWCGRSAIVLAWACRDSGTGIVHACDLFPARDDWWQNEDGTYSFAVTIDGRRLGAYQDQTVWAQPYESDIAPIYKKFESIYDLFCASIKDYGADNWVHAVRGDSETFAASASSSLKLRLAFIDGDHGYEAVTQDFNIADRFLKPGGWIAFDDAFTSYQGVDRAITEHVVENPRYESAIQLTRKMIAARKMIDKT